MTTDHTMRLPSFLILLVVSTGINASEAGYSDEEYTQLLIGSWYSQDIYGDGDTMTYFEKKYNADGTSNSVISERVRLPSGQYQEVTLIEISGIWRIENGVLVMEYWPSNGFSRKERNGKVTQNKIISIDTDKAVFSPLKGGAPFERYRK